MLPDGSGGSYAAASYLARIHEEYTSNVATSRTPLSFLTSNLPENSCVALISASGRNKDILRSLKFAVKKDIENILIITNTGDSPLANRGKELGNALVFDLDLSVRRDGYLATNTLLGTVTTVYKAYHDAYDLSHKLPQNLGSILHPDTTQEKFLTDLKKEIELMSDVDTLLTLHGGWSSIGAIDTESRMAESGLKNIQLTDARNFAHGRHQWIVQRKDETGVIAYSDPEVSPTISKTLNRLPDGIPQVRVSTDFTGPVGGISQLVKSIYITQILSEQEGLDPGRPDVPKWAKRIHNLTPTLNRSRELNGKSTANEVDEFISNLSKSEFEGVVVDYDGTLVSTHSRFSPPRKRINEQLQRLLDEGMVIGVATGRGDSAGEDLREVISEKYWDQVHIGYYNGTEIAPLTKHQAPDDTNTVKDADLEKLLNLLTENNDLFRIKTRPKKISLHIKRDMSIEDAWFMIENMIRENNINAKLLTSGHSLDAVPINYSKLSVVKKVADLNGSTTDRILRIGDTAPWPGNDYEFLSHPLGISVDKDCITGSGGYKITPPGYRGPGATLQILESIHMSENSWRLDVEKITQGEI
jgi:hydroxymethylpyrimidine pyrophosphatase-like HAD family hydrolase